MAAKDHPQLQRQREQMRQLVPSDLRGSFVSLLIHEGRTVVEVAALAGHARATCLRHYARLFAEAPKQRVAAEVAIRRAREDSRARRAVS